MKNLGALALAGLFLFPVYWMFSSAFKPSGEILAKDPIHRENFRKCTVYGWNLHEGKLNLADAACDRLGAPRCAIRGTARGQSDPRSWRWGTGAPCRAVCRA